MDKSILVGLAIVALMSFNIAAFRYLGIFGFFATAASIPFAHKLLDIIASM